MKRLLKNDPQYPALYGSLALLIGLGFSYFSIHWIWPLIGGLYFLIDRKLIPFLCLIGGIGYGYWQQIPLPEEQEIEAIFHPSSLQPHISPFHRNLLYKGTLTLIKENQSFPCMIFYAKDPLTHPSAHCSYHVQGKLIPKAANQITFKPKSWTPLPYTFSLAEIRYQTKEAFKSILRSHLSSAKAALFLGALITGDVDDRLIRYEFGRVGLQHLLAISGFHFGILIAFCSYAFGLFLPQRDTFLALLIFVCLYYLFVGSSPAVQRSWLTASLFLGSKLLQRPSSGLNLLGVALGIELLGNPWTAAEIGFQLSFLSCIGILLFYSFFERKLRHIFPHRNWKEILSLNRVSQHGHLFSDFFRKSISMTLAVNIALLPVLCFHFHQFPLLGLLYNLFIPFWVSIVLILLLMALCLWVFFPPLAYPLFSFTNFLTTALLRVVENPPLTLDYSIQTAQVSTDIVLSYLGILLLMRNLSQ